MNFVFCHPPIVQAVSQVLRFPKSHHLIASFHSNIIIDWVELGQLGPGARYLCVPSQVHVHQIDLNSSFQWTEGKKIAAIIMELFNASAKRHFLHLDALVSTKKLTEGEYVHHMERVEHQNALKAKRLIDEGIALGFFPRDAHFPIFEDFFAHLGLQIQGGHSAHIVKRFDSLNRGCF